MMMYQQDVSIDTFFVRIYMSGPIDIAKQVLRQECLQEGLCVTIDPTLYIYTGGEEHGFVVGLVNYPRFPSSVSELTTRAERIVNALLSATYQHSAMMVTPEITRWVSRRKSQ